jgi:hypothetical protein
LRGLRYQATPFMDAQDDDGTGPSDAGVSTAGPSGYQAVPKMTLSDESFELYNPNWMKKWVKFGTSKEDLMKNKKKKGDKNKNEGEKKEETKL